MIRMNSRSELIALVRYLAADSRTLNELADRVYEISGIRISTPSISRVVGGWKEYKRVRSLVMV